MKRVLLIAYHYPPAYGSGVHRTLAFARHLPAFGWTPTVLSICTGAYGDSIDKGAAPSPGGAEVIRAFGLDSARHLAFRGRYLLSTALPDRWVSWWFGGTLAALWQVLCRKFDLVFSTFPIATAHLIGGTVKRLTGLPWVADFRDPMAQIDYPRDPRVWRSYKRVERKTVARADRLVFTAPGAVEDYLRRYPELDPKHCVLIENGFDEELFQGIETQSHAVAAQDPVTLLHSGLIYPVERNPTRFFQALARLRDSGFRERYPFKVRLRGCGSEALFRPQLAAYGLEDVVELAPAVGHDRAIREMMDADGLLLFQGGDCNFQIPAKTYEYLRAGRPMVAMTDPAGDTARLLQSLNAGLVAPMDSVEEIVAALGSLITGLRNGLWKAADPSAVESLSRRHGAGKLAGLFDQCVARR